MILFFFSYCSLFVKDFQYFTDFYILMKAWNKFIFLLCIQYKLNDFYWLKKTEDLISTDLDLTFFKAIFLSINFDISKCIKLLFKDWKTWHGKLNIYTGQKCVSNFPVYLQGAPKKHKIFLIFNDTRAWRKAAISAIIR